MKTVRDLLLESTKNHGEKNALQILRNNDYYSLSFDRFSLLARRLAAFLMENGLETGDKVGILGVNNPEWVITYMACQMHGYVAIPIDKLLKIGEIEHIIKDSKLKILFADDKFMKDIRNVKKD